MRLEHELVKHKMCFDRDIDRFYCLSHFNLKLIFYFIAFMTSLFSRQCIHEFPKVLTLILNLGAALITQPNSNNIITFLC